MSSDIPANVHSQPDGLKTSPGLAPMPSTVVFASSANASRSVPETQWTSVPAGASWDTPSSTKRARPLTTTYSSSWPLSSRCSSTTRCPASLAV